MAEFYTVITDAGREAVARATQAGEKVNITHFAVGDGGGVPVTPNESQTQLVNECWRGLVATYKQEGTSLIIDTYIPSDEESFTAREMGIFTADGVLFAVSNIPDMRKVLPSEGAVGNFAFGMKIDVSNLDTSYIEIHTDPKLDFIKNSEKGVAGGVATLDEHGNVEQLPELNFVKISDKASEIESTTGTNDTKYMTPLKTSQSILAKKATLQEVQAGIIDNKWVSPKTLENSISLRSPKLTFLEKKSISFGQEDVQISSNLYRESLEKYNTLLIKFKIIPNISLPSNSYYSSLYLQRNSSNTLFRYLLDSGSNGIPIYSEFIFRKVAIDSYNTQYAYRLNQLIYDTDSRQEGQFQIDIYDNSSSPQPLKLGNIRQYPSNTNSTLEFTIYGVENI